MDDISTANAEPPGRRPRAFRTGSTLAGRPRRAALRIAVAVLAAALAVHLVQWRLAALQRESARYWLRLLSSNAEQAGQVLESWIEERRADADIAAASAVPGMEGAARTAPEESRAQLRHSLAALVQRRQYLHGWVIDDRGRVLTSTRGAVPLNDGERAALRGVLSGGGAGLTPPWRAADTGEISIAFQAPVVSSRGEVLGAIVLRVDPTRTLLGTVRWTLPPSRTGQMRLLVDGGDSIAVLSRSLIPAAPPMGLAMQRQAAPAIWRRAVGGTRASIRATDLNGTPVLAAVRPLRGLPWGLVRIVEEKEAFRTVGTQVWEEALIALGFLTVIALAMVSLAHRERSSRLRAVEESGSALAEAQAIASVGSWDWDRERGTLHWSDETFRQHGLEPGSRPPTFETFKSHIHPDDREMVGEVLSRAAREGGSFEYDYRLVRSDDVVRSIHVRAFATVRDGDLLRITGASQDVTEVRRAHEALRASEYRHRVLFQRNPLPMWLYETETLRILNVNDAAVEAYGYSRAEFLAMSLTDLRPPEDVAAFLQRRPEFGVGRRKAGLHRHVRADGAVVEVEIISDDAPTEARPARLVLAHDVTAARRADRAMRDAHALLETLIESSPLAVVTVDLAGRVGTWNGAAERMFGWSAAEVSGQLLPLVPEDRAHEQSDLLAWLCAEPGRTRDLETRRRHRSGREVRVQLLSAALRDARGEVHGIVCFMADTTDRKNLEEQLRQAQKMEAVGRLAGGVAHDFNNLLTAITGYAALMLEGLPAGSEWRSDAEEIAGAADRAAALTNQLLAFSRKQVLNPRTVDLNALVRDDARMLARLVGEDFRFQVDLAPGTVGVLADPSQLQQILMNLVLNARDSMPGGGVIRIGTEAAADPGGEPAGIGPPGGSGTRYSVLSVSDQGCGMPAETAEHIFEPFFTTKPTGKGTGLGLATVYGIVKQSDGRIELDTRVGEGSTFRVLLPSAAFTAQDELPHPGAPASEPDREGPALKILVVEDEATVRALIRRTLLRQGYEVIEAGDARTALEGVTLNGAPDLLITDVILPGIRGPQLAQEMMRRFPLLRVVLVSGYTERMLDAVDMEQMAFLPKPFSPRDLLRTVRELVESGIPEPAVGEAARGGPSPASATKGGYALEHRIAPGHGMRAQGRPYAEGGSHARLPGNGERR